MFTGKVKWYDLEKGYGFIFPEGGKKEVFIHRTELERSGYKSLNVGDFVSYEIKTNHKGKIQAANVMII